MDTTNCATYLIYNHFIKNNSNLFSKEELQKHQILANVVNAYDIWLIDNEYINFGKLLSNIVMNFIKYPDLLKEYKRNHVFEFMKKFCNKII